MATFSDARANVAPIQVVAANPNFKGIQDNSTAGAIQAFGQLGGAARAGVIEQDLQSELEEHSLRFDALNNPEVRVTKDEETGDVDVDISGVPGIEQLDVLDEDFRRLRIKREQGLLGENQVALEAEILLRRAVIRGPGFEPELRKIASDAVGFDVTGAATQTFFGLPRQDGSRRQTLLQKWQEEATALTSEVSGLTFNKAMQTIAANHFEALKQPITDARMREGEMTATEYGLQQASNFEGQAMGVMSAAQNADGTVNDPLKLAFDLKGLHALALNRAKLANTKDGIVNSANVQVIQKMLDQSLQASLSMAADLDNFKLLGLKADAMVDAITINNHILFPAIMSVRGALGETAFNTFMQMLDLAQDNPAVLKDFAIRFPQFRVALAVLKNADRSIIGDILTDIYTGNSDKVSPAKLQMLQAQAQLLAEIAFEEGPSADKDFSVAIGAQFDTDMVRAPISQLANKMGAYSKLTPEVKQQAIQRWDDWFVRTKTNLTAQLKEAGQTIVYDTETKTFSSARIEPLSPFQPRRIPGGRGGPAVGLVPLIAEGNSENIDFLNESLIRLLKNDPQFAKDQGIKDVNIWGLAVEKAINDKVIELPEPVVLKGPDNQDLELLSPGVYGDDEGNLFEVTERGEFSQVGGKVQRTERKSEPEPLPTPQQEVVNRLQSAQVIVPKKAKETVEAIVIAAEEAGVSANLMIAIAKIENGKFDPSKVNVAVEGKTASKALGLFQFTPDTFDTYGPKDGDPNDPQDQIIAAMNFINALHAEFGSDIRQVALHWHDGINKKPPFSKEGIRFAGKLLAELGLE